MTTIKAHRHTVNRIILLIVGLLFLGYCILAIVPWNPVGYNFDLDGSWSSAVHVAFANKIQFGKDLIYTYGPYGFLQVDLYFPETYGYAVGLRLLMAIAVWAGLFKLARSCLSRRDGSVFFLIPICFFFPTHPIWMDFFQFTIVTLPLVLYFYVSKRMSPALVLSLMAVALASLAKFTYLLLSIVIIGSITIDELAKLKRIPQIASVYLGFIWLFWVFAAQDLTNLPAYLINGLEIVKGFSAAMGIHSHLDEVIFYLLGMGIFLLIVGIIEGRNRGWWGILPSLGLAAIFFVTFKGAFTRHDGHALQALFNLAPVILMFTAMQWSQIKKTSWQIGNKIKLPAILGWATSGVIILFMGTTILQRYLGYGYAGFGLDVVKHTGYKIGHAATLLSGRADFQAVSEQSRANIRNQNPLPSISGTVDLYPNEIASIFAYDLDYRPRPVFQSFSAYTSKLARLNAEHLKQPQAADNILFDIKPIDERLASFEDGLSWPEILTRYDLSDLESRYLLLQRNSQPRQYHFNFVTEEVLTLGEWFEVSDTQPVWAKIELQPNLLGKLATTALRLPPLFLEVETADGKKTKYKAISNVMPEGFLLSPVISDRWDFMNFATPNWQEKLAPKQVTRFRIIGKDLNSRFYRQTYQLSLSQLQFPRQSFANVRGWQEWITQIIPRPLEGELQKVAINDEQTGWLAHAPLQMLVDLDGNKQSFDFSFGILDRAVEEALKQNVGDGVEFKIIVLQSNGQEKTLFSRILQPMSNPQDRGIHQASIDLSNIDTKQLILKTLAKDNNIWDWSYWSDLTAN